MRDRTPDESMPSPSAADPLDRAIGRWRGLLYGVATRHGFDGDDLDDIIQEVRIRLWRAEGRRRETRPSDPAMSSGVSASYVYRAVQSAVLDRLRRARVRARHETRVTDDGDVPPVANDVTDVGAMAEALREALATLVPARRAVVTLHLDGKERDVIAAMLGWSEPKVRNLLYRGLADLEAALRAREAETR